MRHASHSRASHAATGIGAHPGHRVPAPWLRRSGRIAGLLLLATGLAWLPLHYLLGAGAGELPHPAEAWLLRLHGLGAWCTLFLLGGVAASHVPHGWQASRRPARAWLRRTGLLLCVLAALMAASGYAMYYLAPEWLRPGLGWAHAAVGLALAIAYRLHRRTARRLSPAGRG